MQNNFTFIEVFLFVFLKSHCVIYHSKQHVCLVHCKVPWLSTQNVFYFVTRISFAMSQPVPYKMKAEYSTHIEHLRFLLYLNILLS